MTPRLALSTVLFVYIGACGGGSSMDPDAAPSDSNLPACATPLSVSPEQATLGAYDGVQLLASGGTGSYRFIITDNASGGSINEDTGAYIAGAQVGVTDTIELTDLRCDGRATATIDVVSTFQVAPRTVEMVPGTSFTFEISGGSGDYECASVADESGGSITAGCTYTAGGSDGVDIVRVSDATTGEYVNAHLTVRADAVFRVAGSGHLFIPSGHHFAPTAMSGSGHLDIQVLSGPLSVDAGELVGESEGEGRVRFTDRFTGTQVEAPVTVVRAYTPDIPRDGERSGEGVVETVGDLDGDGYADGVMGFVELSMGAHYSGAVMVYRGGPNGLESAPAQVFGGTTRIETFGRDIEVADIDNDGEMDLLIASNRSDQGSVNGGAVFIHRGVAGGFFEDAPARILRGESVGDQFGYNLVTCDFDNDGFLDLAVGSVEDENVNVALPAYGQGAVHVFRGSEAGYGDKADFVLYGELPDGSGDYRGVTDMFFGTTVRAGDLDGDGLCDLAVGAPEAARTGSQEDGAVLIYQGTLEDNLLLTRAPVRLYADANGSDGNYGNAIAIADIDGDGKDDLVIGHYRSNLRASRAGAVYIYRGGSITDRDPGDPILPAEADWMYAGANSFDYTGQDLSFTDLDGDARPDLLIGKSRAENGSPINVGHILGFSGATLTADMDADPGHDASADTPLVLAAGNVSQGRLGQAVGGVGRGGILALAGYDDTYGTEAGAPYYMSVSDPTPRLLDLPGQAAGHEFGQGITLYDVNKDGQRDLMLGGPGAAQGALGGNSGMLFSYEWSGDGPLDIPSSLTNGHVGHDGSDRYGYDIASAGDFNDDGILDLAVVARGDSRPDVFDSDYTNPTECPGTISLSGAVFVYMGTASGVASEPAFVAYGPTSSGYTRIVRGGFDFNGDGYDDLLMASYSWNGNNGGFSILYGRADDPAGTTVICDQERYDGVEANSYLGYSAAVLGDLDGDGCDDLAIGAPRENFDVVNQGSIRIMWGWDGSGCPSSPEVTTLVLTLPDAEAGTALDSGGDVDGDGIWDLAVGGSNYRIDFSSVGAAWVVPGAYLLTLPRQSISAGNLPSTTSTDLYTLLPELGDLGRYGLVGPIAASNFGEAVALLPDPVTPGRAALAVGSPRGNYGGTFAAGGVAIHRWIPDALAGQPGLDDIPYAIFGGESELPNGDLGALLDAHDVNGVPTLLVGAPISSERGLDVGAGYVLRFTE